MIHGEAASSVQCERQSDLEKLAKALIEHETLTADEIKQVLDGSLQKTPVASKDAQSDIEALLGHSLTPESLEEGNNEAYHR